MKSQRTDLFPSWQEACFVILCAGILTWKLLLPGFIGIASNGDFGKVAAALSIDGADHSQDNFVFFQSDYVRGPQYYFAPIYGSSEIALAWLASSMQQVFGDPTRFDIRWLGTLHLLLFLAFYFWLLVLLRSLNPIARTVLSLAALWIFADVGSISYFNSFYTDTPAILGALLATIGAVHLGNSSKPGLGALALFTLSALLFVLSKAQHGMLGVFPAAFAFALGWRTPQRAFRTPAWIAALALFSASAWIVLKTPESYKALARFNLIFFSLAPNSRTPAQDLVELGLDPGAMRYAGMNSYMPESPMNDARWRNSFYSRSSYGSLFRFYLRHPMRAVGKLRSDLSDQAWQRRAIYLSNFRRAAGRPAGARDPQFGSWSALRTALFQWWPAHILVWFAFALFVSPWLARREKLRFRRVLGNAIPVVAILAAVEFCTASLADACDTNRHLLMFHIFTDLTVFLALVFLAAPKNVQISHG